MELRVRFTPTQFPINTPYGPVYRMLCQMPLLLRIKNRCFIWISFFWSGSEAFFEIKFTPKCGQGYFESIICQNLSRFYQRANNNASCGLGNARGRGGSLTKYDIFSLKYSLVQCSLIIYLLTHIIRQSCHMLMSPQTCRNKGLRPHNAAQTNCTGEFPWKTDDMISRIQQNCIFYNASLTW